MKRQALFLIPLSLTVDPFRHWEGLNIMLPVARTGGAVITNRHSRADASCSGVKRSSPCSRTPWACWKLIRFILSLNHSCIQRAGLGKALIRWRAGRLNRVPFHLDDVHPGIHHAYSNSPANQGQARDLKNDPARNALVNRQNAKIIYSTELRITTL